MGRKLLAFLLAASGMLVKTYARCRMARGLAGIEVKLCIPVHLLEDQADI